MAAARRWTLEAAKAMLPEVRERTARAVQEAEALGAAREAAGEGTRESARAEERLRDVVSRWVREMEALGLEVKGLWLVDFDSGSGYYCWQWPEERLEYFHTYEAGFTGRARIQ